MEEIVTCLARVPGQSLDVVVASDRVRQSDRMHLLCDMRRISEETAWRPSYTLQTGLAALWQHVSHDLSASKV